MIWNYTIKEANGLFIAKLAEENWGPVISGKSRDEVKSKFHKALKVSLVLRTLLIIDETIKNQTIQNLELQEVA